MILMNHRSDQIHKFLQRMTVNKPLASRIAEWLRTGPLKSSSKFLLRTGLSKAGFLDCVQLVFEYLQGYRLQNPSGQSVSPTQWKSVLWCSKGTSCVLVCAHCLWCYHWAPEREVFISPPHIPSYPPLSLFCAVGYLYLCTRSPMDWPFFRLNKHSSLSLFSYER